MGLHLTKDIEQELTALISEYRETCLWFLHEDCSPDTLPNALAILVNIEKYGDKQGFIRARQVKKWLLQISSVPSAR